jgi:putative oxidoreductase
MNPTAKSAPAGAARTTADDLGLLLIRLILGAVFMFHGSQKLFGSFGGHGIDGFAAFLEHQLQVPLPQLSAWLAACAEFFGGLALVLGFFVRIATIPMIVTMLVAVLRVHRNAFSLEHGGMEYALTLAVVLTGLLLIGGGRITVINLIRSSKSKPTEASSSR